MSKRTLQLTDALYRYLLEASLREPEIAAELRRETDQHPLATMQIAPEQGQFMALLLEIMGARRIIEIGVYTGYSSLCMALALPADGRLIACDNNAEYTAVARRYWDKAGVADKIDLRLAPALKTLEELLAAGEAGQFDFAFIDADKQEYAAYYEGVLPLLRAGGVIAIDNVLWGGQVIDLENQQPDTRVIRQFNQQLREDPRVRISLLPIADGLTLARKIEL